MALFSKMFTGLNGSGSDQSNNNTWRLSVKVGDLVRLKDFCRDSGKLALLVAYDRIYAKIMFVDSGRCEHSLAANLEVISESR